MQPIINPTIFYFINLLNNIYILSFIICFILGLIFFTVFIRCACDENWQTLKEFANNKTIMSIFVISILLLLFIPSEKTMITMLISQNITTNNINSVKSQIFEVVDYIVKNLK